MADHAVVLGAGIAGLTAAAVLADHYVTVTVVERDRLPDKPIDRRGAPQGRHLHSLLSRGSQLLGEFLPGFLADLTEAGVQVLDDRDMGRIYSRIGAYTFDRSRPVADPAALTTYQASRPFLEFHLRQRVAALPNVGFREGCDVGEFVSTTAGRVTGVTVVDRDTRVTETVHADLIVDATGRATRTPLLLEKLGYARPPERTFTANGVYHSQQITIPDQNRFRERMILVLPEGKAQRGGLVACEDGMWTLTVASRANDLGRAPTDLAEMWALAEDFMPTHVHSWLRHAQPLSEVSTYRYPGGVWRRYDQMTRYPLGLVVIGDALCSLDPINGQGMTMATLHADILRRSMTRPNYVDPQGFYRQAASIIGPVWATNARPTVGPAAAEAGASLANRARHWSQRKILEAAVHDVVVTERLMRVANFVDPPKRLLDPAFLARVSAHHAGQVLAHRFSWYPPIGGQREST